MSLPECRVFMIDNSYIYPSPDIQVLKGPIKDEKINIYYSCHITGWMCW